MEDLIDRIRSRLASGAYVNEAAISFSILMPILQRLGWDTSDPDQVIPEYTSGRGRVDFALCGAPSRPTVFVEVKAVGRSLEGDRQLFEYAFHEGAPLCILTDGREWSFYLPSGQGSYEERRVYKLQLDERSSSEAVRVLERYVGREAVRSGQALEDATSDYRDAASRREAARSLPKAWSELLSEEEDLLLELLSDKAEAICGFRPPADSVWSFLRSPTPGSGPSSKTAFTPRVAIPAQAHAKPSLLSPSQSSRPVSEEASPQEVGRNVRYTVFGDERESSNASTAFVDILRSIVARDPERIPLLAKQAKGRSRNHVGRTPEEIYPKRPELARAAEIYGVWMVGLNISNRDKAAILRAAVDVYGLQLGKDIIVRFPNE